MFLESNLPNLQTPTSYSSYGGSLSVMGANSAGSYGGHLLAPEKLIQVNAALALLSSRCRFRLPAPSLA